MTKRGTELLDKANAQVGELLRLIATRGEATLRRPSPGRETLGDGSIGTVALLTARNDHRIASFVHGNDEGAHAAPGRTTPRT